MTDRQALSPSLRAKKGDYHYQSMKLMMTNISLYDNLIKTGPFIRICGQTIWELKQKREKASETLYWVLKIVPPSKDNTEAHIHIYKKSLIEHGQLQHMLEKWRASLKNFLVVPKIPARLLGHPYSERDRPVTEMIEIIQKDSSLEIDYDHLKAEMVLIGAVEPESSITGESYRVFFETLNDRSVMLKLELFKQIVDVRFSTTKKLWAQLYRNNSAGTSSGYPYPPGFQPSKRVQAILAEETLKPKNFYDTVLAGIVGSKRTAVSECGFKKPNCYSAPVKGKVSLTDRILKAEVNVREFPSLEVSTVKPIVSVCQDRGIPITLAVEQKSLERENKSDLHPYSIFSEWKKFSSPRILPNRPETKHCTDIQNQMHFNRPFEDNNPTLYDKHKSCMEKPDSRNRTEVTKNRHFEFEKQRCESKQQIYLKHESAIERPDSRCHRDENSGRHEVKLRSDEENHRSSCKPTIEISKSGKSEEERRNEYKDKQRPDDKHLRYSYNDRSASKRSRTDERDRYQDTNHYNKHGINHRNYSSKERSELSKSKDETRNRYEWQRHKTFDDDRSSSSASNNSCFKRDKYCGKSKHDRKRKYTYTDDIYPRQDEKKTKQTYNSSIKTNHRQHRLSPEDADTLKHKKVPSNQLPDRSINREPSFKLSRYHVTRHRGDEMRSYEKRNIF